MACVAVTSLMRTLELEFLQSNPRLVLHDKQHIMSLHEKLGYLHKFLDESEKKTNDCGYEEKIREVISKAEYDIEAELVEIRHQTTLDLTLRRVLQDVEQLMENAHHLAKHVQTQPLLETPSSSDAQSSSRHTSKYEDTMVGQTKEFEEFKEHLLSSNKPWQVMALVGMGGIGKTTFARRIYDDSEVKSRFELFGWATMSQDHNKKQVLLELCHTMCDDNNTHDNSDPAERLRRSLLGRRYLIILDDIWTTKAWDDVKGCFPVEEENTGSRILLTTRVKEVADYADSGNFSRDMRFLDSDESWNLFYQKFLKKECLMGNFETIGRSIVQKCHGLPLTVVVLAGHLSANMTVDEWKSVESTLNSFVKLDLSEQFSRIFNLSYKHLPCHLKNCFLYLATFPEDSDIEIKKVIRLWIAEGFLEVSNKETVEKSGENYLHDLINRSLIMISERSSNGEVKTCKMHDLLHELCASKAKIEKLLCTRDISDQYYIDSYGSDFHSDGNSYYIDSDGSDVHSEGNCDHIGSDDGSDVHLDGNHDYIGSDNGSDVHSEGNCDRIGSDDGSDVHLDGNHDYIGSDNGSDVHSDGNRDYIDSDDDGSDVVWNGNHDYIDLYDGSHVHSDGNRWLRLKMASQYFDHLSIALNKSRSILLFDMREWKLIADRHLIFPYVKMTADSFKMLRVLDLTAVDYRGSIPSDILLLRYLALASSSLLTSIPVRRNRNLQTLVIGEDINGVGKLPDGIWELPQLRHLELYHQLSIYTPKVDQVNLQTLYWLHSFQCTKQVFLRIPNVKELGIIARGCRCHRCLDNLYCLNQLEKLKIQGSYCPIKLPKYADAFPQNFKKITFSKTLMPWEAMNIISKLRKLEVLKLKNHACLGQEWELTEEDGFPQLKLLLISITDLKDWKAGVEKPFPALEHLVLRNCFELKEMPSWIYRIDEKLKSIHFQHCYASLVGSAKMIEEEIRESYGEEFGFEILEFHTQPEDLAEKDEDQKNSEMEEIKEDHKSNDGGEIEGEHKYEEDIKMSVFLEATSLYIPHQNNPQHWICNWDSGHKVVELLGVWWMEITGMVDTRYLLKMTCYSAYFVFKLKPETRCLDVALTLVRYLKDKGSYGENRRCQVFLAKTRSFEDPGQFPDNRHDGWMEIKLGDFYVSSGNEGEVKMQLLNTGNTLKSGLIVRGIEVRPS